jgi:hypothetical protein
MKKQAISEQQKQMYNNEEKISAQICLFYKKSILWNCFSAN